MLSEFMVKPLFWWDIAYAIRHLKNNNYSRDFHYRSLSLPLFRETNFQNSVLGLKNDSFPTCLAMSLCMGAQVITISYAKMNEVDISINLFMKALVYINLSSTLLYLYWFRDVRNISILIQVRND